MTDHNRLRELARAAQLSNPVPWPDIDNVLVGPLYDYERDYIVAAVNALPALLDENDRLREALRGVIGEVGYNDVLDPDHASPYFVYTRPDRDAWAAARAALESSDD